MTTEQGKDPNYFVNLLMGEEEEYLDPEELKRRSQILDTLSSNEGLSSSKIFKMILEAEAISLRLFNKMEYRDKLPIALFNLYTRGLLTLETRSDNNSEFRSFDQELFRYCLAGRQKQIEAIESLQR